MTSRKYSRKNIAIAPKTASQFKSSVNKILWRKYHLRREDLALSVADVKDAFKTGVTPDAYVATLVGK